MFPVSIELVCPHCKQIALQLPANARPIQEQKISCPSCGNMTKLAKLKTPTGDTFQQYRREIDPKSKISVYVYGR